MGATVESGEMIKTERLAIYMQATRKIAHHISPADIPRRNIVPRAPNDGYALKEARHQVNPALIGKKAMRNIVATKMIGARRPPLRKTLSFFRSTNTNKT